MKKEFNVMENGEGHKEADSYIERRRRRRREDIKLGVG